MVSSPSSAFASMISARRVHGPGIGNPGEWQFPSPGNMSMPSAVLETVKLAPWAVPSVSTSASAAASAAVAAAADINARGERASRPLRAVNRLPKDVGITNRIQVLSPHEVSQGSWARSGGG